MDHFGQALNRAYFFLKFRQRTKKEMSDYLNKKSVKYHWSEETIQKVLHHLEELKFIDDKAFLEWFIDQRSAFKQKSKYALVHELSRYGINKDLIDSYFVDHTLDEDMLAYKALRKRWSRFLDLPPQKQFEKAAAYLSRRGFSFEIIKKTIAKMKESE